MDHLLYAVVIDEARICAIESKGKGTEREGRKLRKAIQELGETNRFLAKANEMFTCV